MNRTPSSGYGLMSTLFITGVIALIVAAAFHRFTGGGLLLAGLLFVASGLMVATNAAGAGSSFLGRYAHWLHRWFPWYKDSPRNDRFFVVFTGGLAATLGLAIAIVGVLVLIGRVR